MKKLYIIIISLIAIIAFEVCASDLHEISDMYIESQGNNKYEAKIKAHELGMRRGVLIIADKMGIPSSHISKIPYLRLKDTFNVSLVANETQTETTYSALVNYQYDLYSITKLLLDYGGDVVDNKFYEYLVLPIFKQKNVISVWDENKQWNKQWDLSRELLEQNKLIYPKPTKELIKILTPDQVLNLSYRNFIEIFQPILLKKVMLVICEFFTNIDTGKSIMKLEFVILGPNDKKMIPLEYQINANDEIAPLMNTVISKVINNYGKLIDNKVAQNTPKDDPITTENEINTIRTIMLSSYIYDDEGLESIKRKLGNIEIIESVTIKHDYDKKYKIIILTKHDDFELAENFYLNGLSFKKYGNIYNLINVIEGK